MKNDVQLKLAIKNNNFRKIVIHHTHILGDELILSLLKDNDVLFFDDCLYSQYLFIKNNINILKNKNIICVLGFSTQIYRTTQNIIIEKSEILHNKIHQNNILAYGGFMTIAEIYELSTYDNIYLAGHGAKHLNLENITDSKINQSKIFMSDINIMKSNLLSLHLTPQIFIFPYEYDMFPCAHKIITNLKIFKYIFTSNLYSRVNIETLALQQLIHTDN